MTQKEPEYSNYLIAVYTAFRDEVHKPVSVLHPCCGVDASPSRVFDNVTYVDREDDCEGAMEAFRKHGLKALKMDIRDYKPQEWHDLLILLNSAIPTAWAAQHVVNGGFILANDYHLNATQMYQTPNEYTLLGSIDFVEKDRRKGDNRVVVSKNIAGLFVPEESGEELKRLRPADYNFITESYPHELRTSGIEPAEIFEEMYVQFQRMMRLPEQLPAKRVADMYIFEKK